MCKFAIQCAMKRGTCVAAPSLQLELRKCAPSLQLELLETVASILIPPEPEPRTVS